MYFIELVDIHVLAGSMVKNETGQSGIEELHGVHLRQIQTPTAKSTFAILLASERIMKIEVQNSAGGITRLTSKIPAHPRPQAAAVLSHSHLGKGISIRLLQSPPTDT